MSRSLEWAGTSPRIFIGVLGSQSYIYNDQLNSQEELQMRPDLMPGNPFPDLRLSDHAGNERHLSEMAGGDPVVLNFYRGWW
jgi:hypothetical protein